ncbi:hypothetical protein D3C73_967160 [compost metagenome]
MPRVGSSNNNTEQSRSSQRPITTFCWFPPDSSDTSCVGLELRMRMASTWRWAKDNSSALLTTPALEISAMLPRAMLALIDCVSSKPSPLRSSVIKAIPCATASAGERMAATRAGEPSATVPLSGTSAPKIRRSNSVRPAPISPDMPKISPARTSKDTSRTLSARLSPVTVNAGAPILRGPMSMCSPSSRPTIRVTNCSLV